MGWRMDEGSKAAAKLARLTAWMTENGMLRYYSHCMRSDNTRGPAWVVLRPHRVIVGSCAAWHADSAAGAVDAWLAQLPPSQSDADDITVQALKAELLSSAPGVDIDAVHRRLNAVGA